MEDFNKIQHLKSYTDLEQSKKLAEILPLESADMWWNYYTVTIDDTTPLIIRIDEPWVGSFNWENKPDNIPCWSLSALLQIINKIAYSIDEDASVELSSYKTIEWDLGLSNTDIELITEENPVDACYEMVLKLKEMDLL